MKERGLGSASVYPEALAPLRRRFRPPWAPAVFVGPGWWSLLVDLDEALARLDPLYEVTEVREDLADLVFLAHPRTPGVRPEDLWPPVGVATVRALRTCEVCGRRGRFVRQGRFFIVLCWDHQDERGAVPVLDGDDLDAIVPRLSEADLALAIASAAPAHAYTSAGHADAVACASAARAQLEGQLSTWLTTAEMAAAVDLTPSTVRRRAQTGTLCAARRGNGRLAFPRWQVGSDGLLLPGLGRVLPRFPVRYDAVAITTAMTLPRRIFGGVSAARWLDAGGDVAEVEHFVRGLG